jgi:hypothetical protein
LKKKLFGVYLQVARIYAGRFEVRQELVRRGKRFHIVDGKLEPNQLNYSSPKIPAINSSVIIRDSQLQVTGYWEEYL